MTLLDFAFSIVFLLVVSFPLIPSLVCFNGTLVVPFAVGGESSVPAVIFAKVFFSFF